MSDTHKQKPLVGIVMGSDSDLPIMAEAAKTLKQFSIPFEIEITSAHRSPVRTADYARTSRQRGLKAIIVGAGGAAHLAGVIAAETTLPVIGVPIANSPLSGMDSLLSTVQMPGGVPVATMAVGKAGAVNAAIYATQIIGTYDAKVEASLTEFKERQARTVAEKSEKAKREFQV
jgi:5-(carboxyamino)imidazole ribonucleotide mutase